MGRLKQGVTRAPRCCCQLHACTPRVAVKNAGLRASFPASLRLKPEKEKVLLTMQSIVMWVQNLCQEPPPRGLPTKSCLGFLRDLFGETLWIMSPLPCQDIVAMPGSLLVLAFIFSDPLPFKKQIYLFLSCMYICTACTPTPKEAREGRELH